MVLATVLLGRRTVPREKRRHSLVLRPVWLGSLFAFIHHPREITRRRRLANTQLNDTMTRKSVFNAAIADNGKKDCSFALSGVNGGRDGLKLAQSPAHRPSLP